MFILGLTGPIASGKSTVSTHFRSLGGYVLDADALVHELYGAGTPCTRYIEGCVSQSVLSETGAVDRQKLSVEIQKNLSLLKKIEAYVHPKLRTIYKQRILENKDKYKIFVLDVPLLFNGDLPSYCDAVAVCCCPLSVRKKRALERKASLTENRFDFIASRQMSDEEYAQNADIIIDTTQSKKNVYSNVSDIFQQISKKNGTVFEEKWDNILR